MSEARDKYKEVDPWKENNRAIFIDYIEELEHQITELKESQKQKRIIRLCERLDKAEQQKAELIEIAKEYSYLLLSQQTYNFNNEHDLKRGEEIEELIEKILHN